MKHNVVLCTEQNPNCDILEHSILVEKLSINIFCLCWVILSFTVGNHKAGVVLIGKSGSWRIRWAGEKPTATMNISIYNYYAKIWRCTSVVSLKSYCFIWKGTLRNSINPKKKVCYWNLKVDISDGFDERDIVSLWKRTLRNSITHTYSFNTNAKSKNH